MEIRPILIFCGGALLVASPWLGDIAIWFGAPLLFLGIAFTYIDAS